MSEARGGIGSVGPVGEEAWIAPEQPAVEVEDDIRPPDAIDISAILTQMRRQSEEITTNLTALVGRLDTNDAAVAQIRGQLARLDSIFPQYNAAIQQMNARIEALAKQVMRNMRYAALDIASKTRLNNERGEAVVKNAGQYLAFLEPPEPQSAQNAVVLNGAGAEAPAEGIVGEPEDPPPGTVTH